MGIANPLRETEVEPSGPIPAYEPEPAQEPQPAVEPDKAPVKEPA